MSVNLFVYGSLLNEKVLDILLKRKIESFPAILKGYHRFSVRSAPYPAIAQQENGTVEGKVLLLKENEKILLDEYEGPDYLCIDVTKQIQSSVNPSKVLTYSWIPSKRYMLYGSWSYEAFEKNDLESFLLSLK